MPDDKDKRAPATTTGTGAVAAELGQPADATTSEGSAAPTEASPKAASRAKDKGPACPTCGGALETYLGEAAHKLGSFWCRVDGRRWHPHEIKAAQQDASPTDAAGSR